MANYEVAAKRYGKTKSIPAASLADAMSTAREHRDRYYTAVEVMKDGVLIAKWIRPGGFLGVQWCKLDVNRGSNAHPR